MKLPELKFDSEGLLPVVVDEAQRAEPPLPGGLDVLRQGAFPVGERRVHVKGAAQIFELHQRSRTLASKILGGFAAFGHDERRAGAFEGAAMKHFAPPLSWFWRAYFCR